MVDNVVNMNGRYASQQPGAGNVNVFSGGEDAVMQVTGRCEQGTRTVTVAMTRKELAAVARELSLRSGARDTPLAVPLFLHGFTALSWFFVAESPWFLLWAVPTTLFGVLAHYGAAKR